MATTTRQNLRYPGPDAAPNGPQQIQDLATDVDNKAGYRGFGSAWPANPISGDRFFHSTFQCVMQYVGGSWFQNSLVVVNDATQRANHVSGLNAAGLQMHNGFQVYQADSDVLHVCTASSTNTLAPVGASRWVTSYNGAVTYSYTLPASTPADMTGLNFDIAVPADRQLDVELVLPSIEMSAGGLVVVRLLINDAEVDAATIQSTAAMTGPASLTGDLAPTSSARTINVRAQGYKVGGGTYVVGGSSSSGPRLRHRLI